MPSSKKQRGRQRKKAAANKGAAVAGDCTEEQERDHEIDGSFDEKVKQFLNDIIKRLRRGEIDANLTVLALFEDKYNADLYESRKHVIDSGLVDVVLSLLKRCESSEFQDIVRDAEVQIFCPSKLIEILANISGSGLFSDDILLLIRMQIAREFGPVVKCMCKTARKFFHNTEYWYSSAQPFIGLVENIVGSREAIPILLKHKGLIEFMVQSVFWKSHHPDIVGGLCRVHSIDFLGIAAVAKGFIDKVAKVNLCKMNGESTFDAYAYACLKVIGTTPIAGRNSDLFVMHLISHLESTHLRQKTSASESSKDDRINSFWRLQILVRAGCVDKDVISGVLRLAKHDLLNYKDAQYITRIMLNMFVPHRLTLLVDPYYDIAGRPIFDNLFAFAVDHGVIETCLGLLVRFKDDGDGKVLRRLLVLSQFALNISMSMKSSKAFTRQHSLITKAFQDTEAKLEGCNKQCQDVTRRVKMIMHLKDNIEHYAAKECCRCCGKDTREGALKPCSACIQASYCSRTCQEEDWGFGGVLGHGSYCHDRSIAALDVNIHVVVQKLMYENYQNLLAQAILRSIDILHQIVIIDVRAPSMALVHPESFIERMPSEFRDSFAKKIGLNRSAGFMTCVCYFYSCHDVGGLSALVKKHKLANDSWEAAQSRFKNGKLLDEIHRNQQARDSLGPFFCD